MDAGLPPVRRAVVVGAAAVAFLVLIAVAVAGGGPVEFGQPRVGGWQPVEGEGLSGVLDGDARQRGNGASDPPPPDTPWAVIVLGLLATLAAAAALRSLRTRRDDRRGASHPPPPMDLPRLPDTGDEPLTALRRAAHGGRDRLSRAGAGEAADAVVACWLALEQAAAEHGAARRPAQTPTEFTVDLLAAHEADAAATRELLRLYHRARFSFGPLPLDAGGRAAAALDRIARSLS